MKEYSKRKDFKQKQGLEDKFVVSYAGILSPYQGIDNLLDAARLIKDEGNDDIMFYIVGDGSEKDHLEQRIDHENLTNVCLMPFQERKEYFNIINSSDACIVSLDAHMKAPCLPGKIKDLLGMGKPIIAIVPDDTETARIIKEVGGNITDPEDITSLVDTIRMIINDHRNSKIIEKNGPEFISKNMNVHENVLKYEKILGEKR